MFWAVVPADRFYLTDPWRTRNYHVADELYWAGATGTQTNCRILSGQYSLVINTIFSVLMSLWQEFLPWTNQTGYRLQTLKLVKKGILLLVFNCFWTIVLMTTMSFQECSSTSNPECILPACQTCSWAGVSSWAKAIKAQNNFNKGFCCGAGFLCF